MSAPHRHRLWLEELASGPLTVHGERAHYLRHVLRLGVGDALTVLGGNGFVGPAKLMAWTADTVVLEVGELTAAPAAALVLTCAVPAPKADRADWLVEKLTELGVARIAWLETERTIALPQSGGNRAARWQRLAQAAAKQAGRARTPELEGPLPLERVLEWPAELRYVAQPGGTPLMRVVAASAPTGPAILLIGPEGGFTPAELSRAQASGYIPVGLGPHTLRMETAVVAASAMLLCGAAVTSAAQPEGR